MLWKLADNVKYEDDCEVSLDRDARPGGEKVLRERQADCKNSLSCFSNALVLDKNDDKWR